MKTWKPISGAYAAPNGLTIETIGTEAGLEELGVHLRNGLMVPQSRSIWAQQCVDGLRQVFAIKDAGGEIVANGEFKVRSGSLQPMFVRGFGNREFLPGSPEFDAVSAYAAAVDARAIPLTSEPRDNGFVAVIPPAPEAAVVPAEGRWERAMRFARDNFISPFAALVAGVGREAQAAAEVHPDEMAQEEAAYYERPFEDVTWTRLSGAFRAANGVTVEPVGTRSGLRTLGNELENNLFMPDVTFSVARGCQEGRSQMAAIYKDDQGIVAYAEFHPVRGQLVASTCRGFADEVPPMDVARAVQDYVLAVNTRVFATDVAIGAAGFVEGPAPEINPFAEDVVTNATSSIGTASRTGGYGAGYALGGYDGEGELDLDEEEEDRHRPVDGDMEWRALSDAYTAPNGLRIECVTTLDDLQEMGSELRNALRDHAGNWASRCEDGDIQIVRVMAPSNEGWKLVSNAELACTDGRLAANFNRGLDNANASAPANEALASYCNAVNNRTITLNCELLESGFEFDAPANRMGM